MREAIESKVLGNVQKRCDVSNSALRELQSLKKNRPTHDRDKDRPSDKDAEERKHKLKKMKKAAAAEDERPLAVGAHGVARQDGVDLHKGVPFNFSLSACILVPFPIPITLQRTV